MTEQQHVTQSPVDNGSSNSFGLYVCRKYFRLTTNEFLSQCAAALNPIGKVSDAPMDSIGELYGPVWITATIVFCLYYSKTLLDILDVSMTHRDNTDYTGLLWRAINLLYGYILLVPLLLVLVIHFGYKSSQSICYSRLLTIYGYANTIWGPASLLAVFRAALSGHPELGMILEWFAVFLGGIISGLNLTTKCYQYLKEIALIEDQRTIFISISVVILLHLGFTIAVKVIFFDL